jgi:hypothetical protein
MENLRSICLCYFTTKYTKITKRIDSILYLPLGVLRALGGYIWIN